MRVLPLLLLSLAGCGDTAWRDLWPGLPGLGAAPPASEAEEEEPPGSPALHLGLGRWQARATLLQESGTRRLWRGPGGMVVATDGGRVVATAGLSPALVATRFEGPDPLAEPQRLLEAEAPARRLVDLMERERDPAGMRFGLAVTCRLTARAAAGQEGLLLVEEACQAAGRRGFHNRFWVVADTGRVRRAEQWIGPGLPMLVLNLPEE